MERLFQLNRWRVVCSKGDLGLSKSDADVNITVQGRQIHVAAEGTGPVDALSNALRKALKDFYPEIDEIRLADYSVRIENSRAGTAARVKVVIDMRRGNDACLSRAVSSDILDASWNALIEGVSFFLKKQNREEVMASANN